MSHVCPILYGGKAMSPASGAGRQEHALYMDKRKRAARTTIAELSLGKRSLLESAQQPVSEWTDVRR